MHQTVNLGCVVLAAGASKRYGSNKLLESFQGQSVIARAFDAIPTSLFSSIVVVTQYPQITQLAQARHFATIQNDSPHLGLSHSIALGLTALRNCDGALFLVADQPLLRRETIEQLVKLWHKSPTSIVAPAHQGRRGNPCLFPQQFFAELSDLNGDVGGSVIIRKHPNALLLLDVNPLEIDDVDRPEALLQLEEAAALQKEISLEKNS